MSVQKSYAEINEKIKAGQAVVVTAEEVISVVAEKGLKDAAQEIDVVTTGTFGPMCSSGAFLNLPHTTPRMKFSRVYLNGVNAYTGIAAVDVFIGATEIPEIDTANQRYPGEFNYGGGHVIEDLVAGKEVKLEATSYGTECYPRQKLEEWITINDIKEAFLFNPRNCYQNYNVAVNLSDRTIYTYMGILKSNMGNANYCSAGQLSPLLNDPLFKTIGIGTRVFLGGGVGYVSWNGTQHNPNVARTDNDVPRTPAGTLSLTGDLKGMKDKWLRGVSFMGYGTTLNVGVGIPIPILNEEILRYTTVKDEDIFAQVVDYSEAYPQAVGGSMGEVSYAQLKSGKINIQGKEIATAPLSSYYGAKQIAETLKDWITKGEFLLGEPVQPLPTAQPSASVKAVPGKNAKREE